MMRGARFGPEASAGAHHALDEAWTAGVDDYATALSVSRDGTLVAIGTGTGMVVVLDAESGAVRLKRLAHPGGVLSLDWSPRERVLATSGQDGRALLFDAQGATVAELPGTAAWVEHVAWAPDGKQLATASGKVVRIWTAVGDPVWTTDVHESTVTGLAWNRKGTELATACYGGVQLFRVAKEPRTRRLPWRGSLISLAWCPTDAVVACGTQECSVHFWRLGSGQDSEMSGFPSKPRVLAWDADGKLLATGGDLAVTIWVFDGKGPEGRAPIQLTGHQALCTALAFHPKETRLASGADDMGVIVWNPRKTSTPAAFGFLEETVTALAWTLGGNLLIGADAVGTVRAWVLA